MCRPNIGRCTDLGGKQPRSSVDLFCSLYNRIRHSLFRDGFLYWKMKWLLKYSNTMMKIGGVLMILTGVFLYTDKMTEITIFFIKLYGGFTGF